MAFNDSEHLNYLHEDPTRADETRWILQRAVESAEDAFIITSLDMDPPGPFIEYVNPAFTRMTGYIESEVIGKSPRLLQGPRTSRELLERLKRDLSAKGEFLGQTYNYKKPTNGDPHGEEYTVQWFITPVLDDHGRRIKWLAVQRDITRYVQAELDLQKRNEDLKHFVHAVSHDLQEPFRTIVVQSQILQRFHSGSLPEDTRNALDYIITSTKSVGQLIRDLVAYSQATNDNHTRPARIDPIPILRSVLDSLGETIREHQAILHIEDLPGVRIRESHLRQIFQNLISNAIRHRHPSRQPVITVRSLAKKDGCAHLAVEDNGIGIPKQFHREIFGLFRRLNTSGSGTGIGLAIVQRIVENYGGEVWVESDEGAGASFHFTIHDD